MIKKYILSVIACISFSFPGMAASFVGGNMLPRLADREVVKVDEDMYVGVKRLPYKEDKYGIDRREGRTPKIGYDRVYFVFERLTDRNYKFWESFVDDQDISTRRMGVASENGTKVLIREGIGSFQTSLGMQRDRGKYSIWIAYVTRKDPRVMRSIAPVEYRDDISWDRKKWPADKYEEYEAHENKRRAYREAEYEFGIKNDDIEMIFTVFADVNSPITTHMGIFRNYKYFRSSTNPHLNLAMEMHGFAGFASKLAYPHVAYMVTNPANKMQELMRDQLRVGEEIWLGCAKQRAERLENIRELQHDQDLIELIKYTHRISESDLEKFRSIREYEKNSIKEGFSSLAQRAQVIIDFLAAHTVQELNDELKLGWQTKVPGLYHYFYGDSTLADINATYEDAVKSLESEEVLKDRIIGATLRNRDVYIYRSVLQKIDTNAEDLRKRRVGGSDDAFWITKNYLPEPLSAMPPLDNRDSDNWFLSLSDGSRLPFERPEWFPYFNSKGHRKGGHTELLNHLTTVMVSIPALGEIWARAVDA